MVNIIKEDLDIEEALKKKLGFICSFCNTECEIKKGSIRTKYVTINKTEVLFMNRFEFNEVMKTMRLLTTDDYTAKGCFGPEAIYYWKNLDVWYDGNYSVEIAKDGRSDGPKWDYDVFPELKKIIFQKYPQYIDKAEIVFYHADSKTIIPRITIKTKDGLILFLNEAYAYIVGKKFGDFDELVKSVNEDIIGKINPTISAYEWMQTDGDNKEKYNSVLERDLETESGKTFRQTLDEFDKAVNPFLCEDTKLDILGNVRIEADCGEYYFGSYDDGKYHDGCCSLKFFDLNTYNRTEYKRYPSGFNFSLNYDLDEYKYYHIAHLFYFGSEEIVILSHGKGHEKNISLRYNLTDGTIIIDFSVKTPATKEQIAFIYDELLKATDYASKITIEKMKKKSNAKKLK